VSGARATTNEFASKLKIATTFYQHQNSPTIAINDIKIKATFFFKKKKFMIKTKKINSYQSF
jgi:hypothetical protein